VLQAHTDKHMALINGGGCQNDASYCDGAYTIRAGKSFANKTAGRIPRNILKFSHNCADKKRLIKVARDLGLPIHGATMPLSIAKFLIRFLTGEGEDELVADPFGGWFRTAKAAEDLGRRWIACDLVAEYVRGGAEGVRDAPGYALGAEFNKFVLQPEEGKRV
jgi:site-specific DNA-methyltransferase (cytosine-N4-specific)